MKNYFFDGGETQNLAPNTVPGWMVQLFGTYFGFGFLFYGVVEVVYGFYTETMIFHATCIFVAGHNVAPEDCKKMESSTTDQSR